MLHWLVMHTGNRTESVHTVKKCSGSNWTGRNTSSHSYPIKQKLEDHYLRLTNVHQALHILDYVKLIRKDLKKSVSHLMWTPSQVGIPQHNPSDRLTRSACDKQREYRALESLLLGFHAWLKPSAKRTWMSWKTLKRPGSCSIKYHD